MSHFSLIFLLLLPISLASHPPLQEAPPTSTRSHLHGPSPFPFLDKANTPFYTLNGTFAPSKYVLQLSTYLDEEDGALQFTAPGSVTISLQVTEPTDRIILHVNPDFLEVTQTSVMVKEVSSPGWEEPPTEITFSGDDKHYMYLDMGRNLSISTEYEIYAEFVAQISTTTLDGLYLSYYTNSEGELKRLATTQMQAYSARQLFPCFDEPGLRAVFELSVTHKNNYTTVLGNSDVLDSFPIDAAFTRTVFQPTVPMATYLFAMLVSDFDYVQAPDAVFNVPVRTYAPPPVIARSGGDYSADIADKMLQFFDTYFATDYPMMKMDSVHVPHFSAGAMENWGLNIYREAYLIYYPNESLESYKNLLTSVVSHELAHQNFGNLVTCASWQELWLNEGFATYVSYLGVDAVRPEFNHREFILNDAFQYSMRVDVSSSSHPIVNDALTPAEIDSYFTGITYEKGGSINRMTEGFLTEETYQKGLQLYLQNMAGKSVVSTDLFRYLDEAAATDGRLPSGLTVDMILKSWTLQKSHPLVRVSVGGPNTVYITQERYADPEEVELWYVPVSVVTDTVLDNNVPALWLDGVASKEIQHDTSKFIMINNNATGYYRVLYDAQLTYFIQEHLAANYGSIQPLSRSQLLDDYFNLAAMGFVDIKVALEFTKYLAKETHFTVWEVVFTQFRRSFNLANDQEFDLLKYHLGPKITQALASIGLEQAPEHVGSLGILRSKLIDWACALGQDACVHYAQDLHSKWETDNIPPPLDIQASITCTIVATGGGSGFDFILLKYIGTDITNPLKLRLLNALACSGDEPMLAEILADILLPNSAIDEAHKVPLIVRIAVNTVGRRLVVALLNNNLDRVIELGGLPAVGSILSSLSTVISTQEELDAVLKFVTDNAGKLVGLSTITYMNNIRSNLKWKTEFGERIFEWMREDQTEVTEATTPSVTTSMATTEAATTVGYNGSEKMGPFLFIIFMAVLIVLYLN